MARVHVSEPFVAVEIAYETTWGTVATTGWERLHPLVEPGETLTLQRPAVTSTPEFTQSGGRSTYDYGRSFVQGTITIRPAYNPTAYGALMRELHGGPDFLPTVFRGPAGVLPGGTPTGYGVHGMVQASFGGVNPLYEGGVGRGLTIRVWKSGKDDTGRIDRFVGCIVTKMRWNQPVSGPPTVTFTIIGKQLSVLAASALIPVATPTNLVLVRARDLKNANRLTHAVVPAIFLTGAALGYEPDVRSFSFEIDSGIELDRAYVTAPDNVGKPAHLAKWKCTGEMSIALQQEFGQTGRPHREYLDGVASQIRLRYVSDQYAYDGGIEANEMPWAIDWWFPNVGWTSSKPNLAELGSPPHVVTFEGFWGNFPAGQYTDNLLARAGQWMYQVVATEADSFGVLMESE